MPLPPYIRHADDAHDAERYQTVYAKRAGAVAAPTAGLHFTAELLEALRGRGAHCVFVTLHVGAGTFQPVTVEDLSQHRMHSERYAIPEATAHAIATTRACGRRPTRSPRGTGRRSIFSRASFKDKREFASERPTTPGICLGDGKD